MDLDAENAVLGGALQPEYGPAMLRQLATMLQVTDFCQESHRTIFARMLAMQGAGLPVDQITIVSALRDHDELDAIGGPAKIAQLCEAGLYAIPARTSVYVAPILEAAHKRTMGALGQRIAHTACNGASAADVLDDAMATVDGIRRRLAARRPDEAPSELTALLAHRFPPRADVIGRGLLPRGGLLGLGGAPKMGKTLLVDNALLQRARGRPWLGFPTDPGITLKVQSELRAQVVAERFGTMLRHEPEPFPEGRLHVKSRRGVMLDEPSGLAQIAAWIEETGADLLVVDPLARHMAGDENSNHDMSRMVRAIDSLIERYGVAVWLVHHPSKPKDGDTRTGGMRLRGASALFGAADTVVMMDRSDDAFTLTFELRHAAAPEPMRLTRTEDLWFIATDPDPELTAFAALTVPMPLPYNVLVSAAEQDLKLSKATAKRRIPFALAVGLLEKDPDGLYRPGSAYRQRVSQSHEVSTDA
jgi:hypothetical protein